MIDKKSLSDALTQSTVTGRYETVDDDHSARICLNGSDVEAMLIDHHSLALVAKAIEFNAVLANDTVTHDTLTALVNKIDNEVNFDEDFNLMGIYTYGDLLRQLKGGTRYGYVETYRGGTKGLHPVVWADSKYVYWNNYGSSADEANVKGLKFVIEKIFNLNVATFIRKYVAY